MSQITQPLKWHGGKHYLAKWIISHFPPHVHYVEPYFGGGSVLLSKPKEWIEGHSEVVNDLNCQLTNFWSVLSSPALFEDLQKELSLTPFSYQHFDNAKDYLKYCESGDNLDVYKAAVFFIKYRQSRQGLGKDFATLSRNRTRRGMNEQVSSWLSAVEGLPQAHERLQRVVILNQDAPGVIKSQDGPNTLFYLDPPYMHETRTTTSDYEHEMSLNDHVELLDLLSAIEGKFLLSGYRSEMYDAHVKLCGWRCEGKEIDNKSSGKKVKDKKIECLWMNY